MTALHHGALWVRDLDASVRFYRDGIGLTTLMDHEFDGLARLADLGLGGEPRRVEVAGPAGPVAMATVRDPDGVLVELIGADPGS